MNFRNSNSNVTKIEIDGIPPIAVEALLEYCYKDRYSCFHKNGSFSVTLLLITTNLSLS